MFDHRHKPKSSFIPPSSNTLAGRSTPASRLATLQARAKYSKVDDLSAVSRVLKAHYQQQQASKLQAATLPLEEEKQGKLASAKFNGKLQSQQLQNKEDWQKLANPEPRKKSSSGISIRDDLIQLREVSNDLRDDPRVQGVAIGLCFREHGFGWFLDLAAASIVCLVDNNYRTPLCVIAVGRVVDRLGKYIKCVKDKSKVEPLSDPRLSELEKIHNRLEKYIYEENKSSQG